MAFINYCSKTVIRACEKLIDSVYEEEQRQNEIVDRIEGSDGTYESIESNHDIMAFILNGGYEFFTLRPKINAIAHLRWQIKEAMEKRKRMAGQLKEIAEESLMAESDGFIYLSEEDVRFIKPYL